MRHRGDQSQLADEEHAYQPQRHLAQPRGFSSVSLSLSVSLHRRPLTHTRAHTHHHR